VETNLSTQAAVAWTVDRIRNLSISERQIEADVINTCSEVELAKWRLLNLLSSKYNHTSDIHLFLASARNKELVGIVSALQLPYTEVFPVSPHHSLLTLARLASHRGWSEVNVVSSPGQAASAVGEALAGQSVCVVNSFPLPDLEAKKDTYSSLTNKFRESDVLRLVLSGPGNLLTRFILNLHQLNFKMDIVVLPWDGALDELVGSEVTNSTILSVVPKRSILEEMTPNRGSEKLEESPLSWQLVKAIYGVIVLNYSSIDDVTAKDGLQLSRQETDFKVDKFDVETLLWDPFGVYKGGDFSWGRSPPSQQICDHCTCTNGVWRSQVSWRREGWVIALSTLAGLGVVCCLVILVFLCAQCGQVLEGGQTTTFLLLLATISIFVAMLPFCFRPGEIVCVLRTMAPTSSLTFLVSILLSRTLLLATADTEGLPGHASGCLQGSLLVLMLGVEAALLGLEFSHRKGSFFIDTGHASDDTCFHRSWIWLGLLIWPGLLLLVQTFSAPGIWRSRRNYKEGVLFSLASVAVTLVTAAWVTIYILCAELYGNQWEDISVCAGLVATATVVLLIVFIPKVYLMTVWGPGRDVSLQLPGTTTSTLHTDTLDYIPSHNIYKTPVNEHSVAYVNLDQNGGSRGEGLTGPSVHYGSAYIMGTRNLLDAKANMTYRLDRNSEPAENMSWEAFNNSSNRQQQLSQSQPTLPLHSGGIPSTRL